MIVLRREVARTQNANSASLIATSGRAFLLSCLATLACCGPRSGNLVQAWTRARRGARLGTLEPCRAASAVTRGVRVFAKCGPEESNELPSDRDDDLVRVFAARLEPCVAPGQPPLGLLGDGKDALGLALTTSSQFHADRR